MIDWQSAVLNLRNAGFSCAKVAQRVKMDSATVRRLSRGEISEPKFSQGMALLDLHFDICNDRHNSIIKRPGER